MPSNSILHHHRDNISSIFLTTALAMMFTEATGVVAVLIDGIIASQFLGEELYAGISLLRPFTRIILVLAGFFASGCAAVCSRMVTQGKRDDANGVFNLAVLLALAGAAVLILFCLIFPETTLRLCGVPMRHGTQPLSHGVPEQKKTAEAIKHLTKAKELGDPQAEALIQSLKDK